MGPCLSVLLWTEALLRGLQRKTWPKATREEKNVSLQKVEEEEEAGIFNNIIITLFAFTEIPKPATLCCI